MRDSEWNLLSENFSEFQEFVHDYLYVTKRNISSTITVNDSTLDMLVNIAIALNGCLDNGDLMKLDSSIVEHHLDRQIVQYEDDEDDEDE